MRKSLLLLVAGSIALSAGAQESSRGMLFEKGVPLGTNIAKPILPKSNHAGASKTTGATDRWYGYYNYFESVMTDAGSAVDVSAPYMWQDTTALCAYSGGTYGYNNMVSEAIIFHPWFFRSATDSGYNNHTIYPGEMRIGQGNAYTIDSFFVQGAYGTNLSKPTIVDTLRVAFVKGNGGPSSSDDVFSGMTIGGTATSYGIDPLPFHNIRYDSVNNRTTQRTGTTYVQDIYLTAFDSGTFARNIKLNTPLSCTAGQFVGVSVSFKSGDVLTSSSIVGDTVVRASGSTGVTYDYNMFRPSVLFKGTSTAAEFPPYGANDNNIGLFKVLPNYERGWGNAYIPMWAWSSGSGGSTLQFPVIALHAICPSCGVTNPYVPPVDHTAVADVAAISNFGAYPNPAGDKLNVTFNLSNPSAATVTLTNVLGQVVAAQTIESTTTGKAVFNTAELANGVYVYTLTANGSRATGRVVVAH